MKKGFTLMELLIVIAILGILSLITMPLYTEQITKSRRADAKVALLDLAARMERYYAEHHTYATATIAANPTTDVLSSKQSPEGFYNLSIASQTSSSFIIKAIPIPGSAQAINDTKCGSFGLNQLGQKSITGTGTVAECW